VSVARYLELKESGLEWLGKIPTHWNIVPLKHCITKNDGGVWGEEPDGLSDTIVLRSTEQTVGGDWQIEEPAKRKLSQSEIESALLAPGDLLITKSSGSSLHIGKTTLVDNEIAQLGCCYSNFMQRIRTTDRLLPIFTWYVLNNDFSRRQFDLLSNSTTGLANLNGGIIGRVHFPLPPLEEQKAIVSFLDRETSKIDALVAEQRRLVELLKEKRQAVISHAVTKGLDPNVPMKPSGIEWLGDVPEGWLVGKLSYVTTRVGDGLHGTPGYVDSSEYRFINGNNLSNGRVLVTDVTRCVSETEFDRHRVDLDDSTLLLSINGTVGNLALYRGENVMLGKSAAYINCKTNRLERKFLFWFLQSRFASHYFDYSVTGTTIFNLSLESIRKMPVPIPCLKEQGKIAERLTSRVSDIDRLLSEMDRTVSLLQERRTALISEAVTGKIDVRAVAS